MSKNPFAAMAQFFSGLSKDEQAKIQKAYDDASDRLDGQPMRDVQDMWNVADGQHRNPPLHSGPAVAMRGSQAEGMGRQYSDPQSQDGLTQLASEMSRMFADFGTRMEKALGVSTKAAATTANPGTQSADATFFAAGQASLAKARGLFRKAVATEGSVRTRAEALSKAADALKAARRLLSKASSADDEPADDGEIDTALEAVGKLEKQIAETIDEIKADLKDEPAEGTSAAEADATSKAAVRDALAGNAVLQTSIQGLLSEISGRTVTRDAGMPDMAKARSPAAQSIDMDTRIQDAETAGQIDADQGLRAMSLLQLRHARDAGKVPPETFARQLKASPEAVQQLFTAA